MKDSTVKKLIGVAAFAMFAAAVTVTFLKSPSRNTTLEGMWQLEEVKITMESGAVTMIYRSAPGKFDLGEVNIGPDGKFDGYFFAHIENGATDKNGNEISGKIEIDTQKGTAKLTEIDLDPEGAVFDYNLRGSHLELRSKDLNGEISTSRLSARLDVILKRKN